MIAGQRLPVARYRFQFRVLEPLHLPPFAGFLLRGMLGRALREIVCVTRLTDCGSCMLQRRCAYPRLFDPPPLEAADREKIGGSDPPSPYVIEPPSLGAQLIAKGEHVSVGLVLFGQALQELPLFVQALRLAFSQAGVGHERLWGRAELEDVLREDGDREISVWEHRESRTFPWLSELVAPSFPTVRSARLTLLTPLCLKHRGHILGPRQIRARPLVTAITRRATVLFSLHAGMRDLVSDAARLALQAEALDEGHKLRPYGAQHRSVSQLREIRVEGVVGVWMLRGELTDLAPWLWLGQWLHAGKSTVMGLGRYQVELSA